MRRTDKQLTHEANKILNDGQIHNGDDEISRKIRITKGNEVSNEEKVSTFIGTVKGERDRTTLKVDFKTTKNHRKDQGDL